MNQNVHRANNPAKCVCFLLILLSFSSCSDHQRTDSSFTINGQFKNASGRKFVLQEIDLQDIKNLDSVICDDQGRFIFTYKPEDLGFYLLKTGDGKFITLLLKKGDNITITGDLKTFTREYNLTGSKEALLLKDFYDRTRVNKAKGDSLMQILKQHQYSPDYYKLTISFDTIFQHIWQDQKKLEKNYIDKNIKSLTALIVLNYAFGPRPVLSEDEDFDYYLKVDSSLMKVFPSNKHVIYHHKRIVEYKRRKDEKMLELKK